VAGSCLPQRRAAAHLAHDAVDLAPTVICGKAILPNAHNSDLYLSALGVLLTIIFMAGLLFRPRMEHARLGVDSIAVLVVYLVGVVGLTILPS